MLKLEKDIGNGGNTSAAVNVPFQGAITISRKNGGIVKEITFNSVDWEPMKKAIDIMLKMAESDKE